MPGYTEKSKTGEDPEAKRSLDLEEVNAHLSNERTFLAWAWTGMMLMGFGVAIAKTRIAISDFSQSMGSGAQTSRSYEISPILMGVLFLILGILTIVLSACRYLTVQSQIRQQRYRISNFLLFLFLIGIVFLSGTLITHVLLLRQTTQ
jgi:putative membrane protein